MLKHPAVTQILLLIFQIENRLAVSILEAMRKQSCMQRDPQHCKNPVNKIRAAISTFFVSDKYAEMFSWMDSRDDLM